MKTKEVIKLLLVVLLFQCGQLFAQDKYQSYWVHEDYVIPAKLMEYEGIAKELIAALNEHNIGGIQWLTLASNDFRYAYVSPVENMAALDEDGFSELREKMGKEAFSDLFARMDHCYKDHTDYMLTLDTELSYMPEGMTQTPEGENYRENGIYYFSPANMGKALELAKKFKELYTKKGSKMHYRVYRSGFGADGTYLMVAVAAKNAADLETKSMENRELLGEDFEKLRMDMLQLMDSSREMKGWIRPDLGYAGTQK